MQGVFVDNPLQKLILPDLRIMISTNKPVVSVYSQDGLAGGTNLPEPEMAQKIADVFGLEQTGEQPESFDTAAAVIAQMEEGVRWLVAQTDDDVVGVNRLSVKKWDGGGREMLGELRVVKAAEEDVRLRAAAALTEAQNKVIQGISNEIRHDVLSTIHTDDGGSDGTIEQRTITPKLAAANGEMDSKIHPQTLGVLIHGYMQHHPATPLFAIYQGEKYQLVLNSKGQPSIQCGNSILLMQDRKVGLTIESHERLGAFQKIMNLKAPEISGPSYDELKGLTKPGRAEKTRVNELLANPDIQDVLRLMSKRANDDSFNIGYFNVRPGNIPLYYPMFAFRHDLGILIRDLFEILKKFPRYKRRDQSLTDRPSLVFHFDDKGDVFALVESIFKNLKRYNYFQDFMKNVRPIDPARDCLVLSSATQECFERGLKKPPMDFIYSNSKYIYNTCYVRPA